MKTYMKVIRTVSLLGQLGFTLVTPPVVLLLLASFLQQKFALGSWIMIAAMVTGLLTAASGAYRFYHRVLASEKKKTRDAKKTSVMFYHHE